MLGIHRSLPIDAVDLGLRAQREQEGEPAILACSIQRRR